MCERGGALYSENATFYSNNVTTQICHPQKVRIRRNLYTFFWYSMCWKAGLLFDKQFIDRHCRLWVDRRSVVGISLSDSSYPMKSPHHKKMYGVVGLSLSGSRPQYIRMKRKRRTGESLSLVSVNCQRQVCHCRLFVVECCLVTYCICADCCVLAVGYGCRLSLSFIVIGCL
jgi:hypothetical protein